MSLDAVCFGSCSACVPNAVLGCTDASANNYNADADTDDGSCAYDVTLTLEVCGGTGEEVRITGPWWGWDPLVALWLPAMVTTPSA